MKKLELIFGGITLAAEQSHPNKMKFRGVLVRLDEPSDKPPSGSQGHKILVSSELAKARLSTIKGMGLNYSPSLDGHAQRRKVGVIENAWIDGKNLCVSGTIWKHDFPEAEKDLKQAGLGMSMEIGDVEVADMDAAIWKLSDFQFLGATILFKNAAAYHNTLAIAASKERNKMAQTATKKKVAAGARESTGLSKQEVAQIAAAVAKEIVNPIARAMQRQTTVLAQFSTKLEEMELDRIAAGTGTIAEVGAEDGMAVPKVAADDGGDDGEDGEDRRQRGEDDEDDEDEEDIDSEATDKGDLEELGSDLKDSQYGDDPGEAGKDTKNHGSDTAVNDELGKETKKAELGGMASNAAYSALKKRFIAMAGDNKELKAQVAQLAKRVSKLSAQGVKISAEIDRRSNALPADVNGLLRKSNYDPREIQASGPLSVEQVDAMLTNTPGLSTVERMTLKNKLLEAGAMEQGAFDRGFGSRV